MSVNFADAMPGFYLYHLRLPSDVFDKLLVELQLSMMQREPATFLPFSIDEVQVGNVRVTRQK